MVRSLLLFIQGDWRSVELRGMRVLQVSSFERENENEIV
jgi:hypothetical protein